MSIINKRRSQRQKQVQVHFLYLLVLDAFIQQVRLWQISTTTGLVKKNPQAQTLTTTTITQRRKGTVQQHLAPGGFAHPITMIATTSAMSSASVSAFTSVPTTVSASLSAFVFNLISKQKNPPRYVAELKTNKEDKYGAILLQTYARCA